MRVFKSTLSILTFWLNTLNMLWLMVKYNNKIFNMQNVYIFNINLLDLQHMDNFGSSIRLAVWIFFNWI